MRIIGLDPKGVLIFSVEPPALVTGSFPVTDECRRYLEYRYGLAVSGDLDECGFDLLMGVHEYTEAVVEKMGYWGRAGKSLVRAIACSILDDPPLADLISRAMQARFNSGREALTGKSIARTAHYETVSLIAKEVRDYLMSQGVSLGVKG
ncbi:MAG TPA: hypothetical protein VGO55_03215 [Allosphingosinicella sp.]|jgi:hypothetical protein|nr:hypothetical protein [Allosphingosinicella sp.]